MDCLRTVAVRRQSTQYVAGDRRRRRNIRLNRRTAHVGRNDDVRQQQKWRLRCRRFRIEDVKPGSGVRSVRQGSVQISLIYDSAPGRINEKGRRLHQIEKTAIDYTFRRLR